MGADIKARTHDENQTPVHYAAQNDAAASLKVLLEQGADMNAMDFKQRCPLQVIIKISRCELSI